MLRVGGGWIRGGAIALQSPYPYFGGKSTIAHRIWAAIGQVDNYVEPFLGSAAVLLARPQPFNGPETVNDLDGFVANFWRAVKADQWSVAEHATNPVNECDLHARHLYLVNARESLERKLCGDPGYCDPKIAGWWVWGMACWIGGGFCSGNGGWSVVDGEMVNAGRGVTKKLPHLGDAGRGVTKRLPHLGDAGQGVTKRLQTEGDPFAPSEGLLKWMQVLAMRMRTVRVCCGDWSRVCGPSVTTKHGLTGVLLDPPYSHSMREKVYALDNDVTRDVEAWCRENGDNPLMRIVLCGYEGEYDLPSWRVEAWKAQGGMSTRGSRAESNAGKERLWLSPHCLHTSLFCETGGIE